MRVILHADDFGFDQDTFEATVECFENGSLSSASIMPTCPFAEDAIEYARTHSQYSFGVHQTYVDGLKPASAAITIPSLVDEKGLFLDSRIIRKKGLLLKIKKDEILCESNAQKSILQDNGVRVSHLDSHGHIHKLPSFLLAMRHMIIDGQERLRLRSVQNMFLQPPSWKSPTTILNNVFRWYIKHHFLTTDYFYMPANRFDTNWGRCILKQMDSLPQEATIEIGVHPGHKEPWRQHEYDDINEFASLLRGSRRHEIINWTDIH